MIVVTCGVLSLDPTLGPYLKQEYGKDAAVIGVIYAINNILYMIICPMTSLLAIKLSNNNILIFLGIFISGVSYFFIGPNQEIQELLAG